MEFGNKGFEGGSQCLPLASDDCNLRVSAATSRVRRGTFLNTGATERRCVAGLYPVNSVHLAEARYRNRNRTYHRTFRREAHDDVPNTNGLEACISHVQAERTLNGVAPIDRD
jgi:hypothetical protein